MAFGPTDLVAFMEPMTPLDATAFTRDRRQFDEQVRTLQGRRGIYVPPRNGAEEAHLSVMRNVERLRHEVALGYSPTNGARDGTYGRIKVRLKRGGMKVKARAGCWAPSLADLERSAMGTAAVVPPGVERSFADLTPALSRRGPDVWFGTAVTAGQIAGRVTWAPRPPPPRQTSAWRPGRWTDRCSSGPSIDSRARASASRQGRSSPRSRSATAPGKCSTVRYGR